MTDQATGAQHLKVAKHSHQMLVELESRIKEVRALRDAEIRAAIHPDTPEHVTMYGASQDLGVPQQTIARIRDRA